MKTLKDLRERKKLTQKDLSVRLIGKGRGKGHQTTIQRMELGVGAPTITRLKDVFEVMGYDFKVIIQDGTETFELDLSSLTRAKDAREQE